MKYIIDLPEDWYKQIKEQAIPMGNLEYLIGANATPLDSFIEGIKGEIRNLTDINPDYPMDRTIHVSRNEVLAIIDKHMGKENG